MYQSIRTRVVASFGAALFLFGGATSCFATLPVVTSMEPRGLVRGEETVVQLRGNNLNDAYKVLMDLPGIEVLDVSVVDNRKVDVKLRAAEDLTPGLYPLRLITRSGIANLRLVGVGAMPTLKEVEPNNAFDTPQQVELNRTIDGVVKREDVDYYRVHLEAGQTINVEIEGIRLAFSLRNQNILDPYIAILNEGRFEVASSDDSALLQQDGFCTFTADQAGDYTIVVRDSAFQGSDFGGYRLHLGTYPRPVTVIPAGGVPGSTLKASLVMSDGSRREAEYQLPDGNFERWGITTEDDNGISPSPNWVRVNELPVSMEQEPNDDRTKAPVVPVPGAYCGVIEKENDYDCFTFEAKKGTKYRVEVFARNVLRSPLDAVLNVFNPKHATLISSDDSRGRIDPYLEFDAKEDGKHTVRIYDHLRNGSPLHAYRIEVTQPVPKVNVTLKEIRRDEAHVVSVPIGGHTAMVVTAQRDRYNGEVNLALEDLPPGVTATTFPMPPGRPEVPVLLTAAADATHDASLFTIRARGDAKNPLVGGKLSQTHKLVLGQNRRGMWDHRTERAAMAVTDPVPFTVEVVQPKTPIVRSGSKSLKVRIERKEGFDGSVAIRTLYNPPGIGINNSRSIAKGKTEVDVPITANGGAGIGTWPIIFMAYYTSKTGSAFTAAKPIQLTVENSLFKYQFPKAAGELGSTVDVTIPIEILREFKGEAEVQLVGIPAGVSSPQPTQPIAADSTSVTFPLVIDAKAKVGNHKTLNCQARVKVDGEVIVQTNGTGQLRIDKPLPPKADAPKAAPEKPKAPAAKKDKPLSRLEQLRQKKS